MPAVVALQDVQQQPAAAAAFVVENECVWLGMRIPVWCAGSAWVLRLKQNNFHMEAALVVAGGAMLYKWWFAPKRMLTNPSHSFQSRHSGSISWDRRSFIVRGQQKLLLSGEFQYWRVPDRERWRGLLLDYKAMGLNCIRIYFHWGYHSPAPNVYHFDGNRDVEHLLSLCSQLQLYVIAAPGPYICAETSGGGFPMWLLQRPDVRIRHMNGLQLHFQYSLPPWYFCF